jgi:hypothetical protein
MGTGDGAGKHACRMIESDGKVEILQNFKVAAVHPCSVNRHDGCRKRCMHQYKPRPWKSKKEMKTDKACPLLAEQLAKEVMKRRIREN